MFSFIECKCTFYFVNEEINIAFLFRMTLFDYICVILH